MAAVEVPQQGQLVQVRERRWVVADVEADELPGDALEPTAQPAPVRTNAIVPVAPRPFAGCPSAADAP